MGRTVCTEPQCLYSTAIPLLPLWAVRPVQSLSACTVQLYLYSHYGPYGLYRASVPVQYSIPLLRLWAVRPVQSFSACTVHLYLYSPYGPYGLYRASVPLQYSYTSTPPMYRTTCTEPQCLYSTAIPLLPLWAVQPLKSLSACTVEQYLYSPQCLYKGDLYLFVVLTALATSGHFRTMLSAITYLLAGAWNRSRRRCCFNTIFRKTVVGQCPSVEPRNVEF